MMAATAIAFCMLLNVSFLAVVASLVGSVNLLKAPGAAEVPIPMAAILWIANVLLARATIRHQSSADARARRSTCCRRSEGCTSHKAI